MFAFLPLIEVLGPDLRVGVDMGVTFKEHRCSSIRPRWDLLIKLIKYSCSAGVDWKSIVNQ